jgi:glycosyltransferase involved in cell wall biosynthesis
VFDSLVFSALKKCSLVLASADERAIMDVVGRSKGELRREDITRFPTRVDLKMFYPTPATEARTRLGLDADASVVVFCGRLNGVKGWRLALDAFYDFQRTRANAAMLFVGDGEDRNALSLKVDQLGLSGKVRLLGSVGGAEVPAYLNAASVVVVTSLYEGWSQTMLEALACGKPIVSTDVSGARDLIKSGENGYVVNSRDPKAFATAMVESLGLPHSAAVSLDIVKPYALASLSHDLKALWPALHDR